MKKIIFTLLAMAGIAVANAQSKGNVEFGLNTGVSFSTITSTDYYGNPDNNISFNVGGSAEYYFSESWGIKAKVIYDRKGWDNGYIYDINTGDEFRTDFNIDYLTVPVMADWHFGRKKNWYLNFGPYVGFLMSAKETRFDTDLKDDFNTTDAGLALGLGVKIPVSNYIKIFFEYDVQAGFSDIFKDNYDDNVFISRDAINVGINFML
ncbi:PorT family protein [Flavobacterium sp. MFBS3-15]|uniref:porin family protein n=1 Tax=Flavobacterium sp. MFBS3-15 TaxID=2989816 RepID=UPI002235D22D|nr:porin family protein [Flavobacterium sp. MFBS3-15]MCW4469615.1 PorT family protein [Flavobacterium sp. MFBS3-15]